MVGQGGKSHPDDQDPEGDRHVVFLKAEQSQLFEAAIHNDADKRQAENQHQIVTPLITDEQMQPDKEQADPSHLVAAEDAQKPDDLIINDVEQQSHKQPIGV